MKRAQGRRGCRADVELPCRNEPAYSPDRRLLLRYFVLFVGLMQVPELWPLPPFSPARMTGWFGLGSDGRSDRETLSVRPRAPGLCA